MNTSIKLGKILCCTKEQEEYEDYKKLFNFVKKINKRKYIEKEIYYIVAYLMIYMNYMSAIELKKYKGVYRSASLNSDFVPPEISKDIQKFLKM